jgi:hypothetical protein
VQWSRLRSQLRELVAPSVRRRIDFHLTHYRKLGDMTHEFLITVDKKKVFSTSYSKVNIETYVVTRTTGLVAYGDGREPWEVEKLLTQREVHPPADITSSIRTYLDLPPQVSLHSSDPVLRALAMIDRRLGERTLKQIKVNEEEHSLVKALYKLRMESLH